ncbi:head-tail connector protein [Xenorhabdus bovienii]|uniref:head-tail connector protein n=1 Tax=Xenorhabdus bovienii TaxID=40576 RepID=UPI0023B3516B|nr:head-tail connector protein [Xenorhabdus bovienii]MDE9565734.1 head-tail connector protein [Xenorhabdus bovienii]
MRIDSPHDDDLLRQYENAALQYALNYTDRKTLHVPEAGVIPPESQALILDEAVIQAILLLIGHWYENRTAVVVGQSVATLPFAVKALLQPYKRYCL